MKFALVLCSVVAAALGQSITVSYDTVYDNASQSLATVACSDGSNGLLTRGFTTFGSLPRFPRIGGVPAVTGWNSPACGTCWQLAYTSGGVTRTVNIIAVDVGSRGFNIARAAMNELTNGQATQLGRVPVTANQVAPSACGL
ncbi:cerato-platanin-related secreted protein [Coprinellus micaceus]|uniref:Cerato-platanin-related secreted protein n=1 Tax=Coprinellus micaceus TaxID=71717 RepID=A0A4Y7TAZ8_COPMI|nr:cerato-platanin-related secreted protein [Coprinellus micaceus]